MSEIYEVPAFQNEVDGLVDKAKARGIILFVIKGSKPNWLEIQTSLRAALQDDRITQSKWTLYETPNYERLFPNIVKECRNQFISQFSSENTNENTISHFQKLWTHHYLKNKQILETKHEKVDWFQSFSSENPNVLFLGASPSLEKDIESMKAQRHDWILFASDTSIGFLLTNKMQPDYIVSFDSGRGTSYHFLTEIPKEIPIITWLGGAPYLFELPNPKILVNTGHPLDQIVEFLFQKEQKLSWPHYQNRSLNLLGMVSSITKGIQNRNFAMSGVSFVAELGKSHCKGTGYERYYLPQVERKKSLEILTKRLYSGTRKGKNQIVWEELQSTKGSEAMSFFSELPRLDSKSKIITKHNMHSFQGFPPSISDLAKWANQDQSGIIHSKTLNTWLRFSPGYAP